MTLFVILSFSIINSVGASSTMLTQTYGGTSNEYAFSLVETSDGGYAITDLIADILWLVKTNVNGNILWNHRYRGIEMDGAYSLVETYDGGFVFAGGTTSYGQGSNDFWVVKTDEYGIILEFSSWIILLLLIIGIFDLVFIKKKIDTKSY